MHTEDREIESFLIDSGLVPRKELEDLKKLASDTGESLGRILIDNNILSEDDLRRVEAYALGVPFIDLKGKDFDVDTLSLIPEPISRARNVVSYNRQGKTLEIAALDISDVDEIDFLSDKLGFKVLIRLTDAESMRRALVEYQKKLKDEFGDVIRSCVEALGEDETAPAKLVDTLLKHAIVGNATDIHIESGKDNSLVRYRIEGKLYDAMILSNDAQTFVSERIKEVSGLSNVGGSQEGQFSVDMNGEKVEMRVSVVPTKHGEKIVLHILREFASGFNLRGLDFSEENIEKIHKALRKKEGLILVVGPKSSGKTTLLYTLIDLLNRPDKDISTIEDPIEFELPRVNQSEIDEVSGYTFAGALRGLMRQDPDVIMLSDIRDQATANLAVAASERSLVIASMQAQSVSEAISKFYDWDVDTRTLASVLDMVMLTRLIPRLSEERTKYHLNKSELASLSTVVSLEKMLNILKKRELIQENASWEHVHFWKSYSKSGVAAIQEVISLNTGLKSRIERAALRQIEDRSIEGGATSFLEDGLIKSVEGKVALEDVLLAWKEGQGEAV